MRTRHKSRGRGRAVRLRRGILLALVGDSLAVGDATRCGAARRGAPLDRGDAWETHGLLFYFFSDSRITNRVFTRSNIFHFPNHSQKSLRHDPFTIRSRLFLFHKKHTQWYVFFCKS